VGGDEGGEGGHGFAEFEAGAFDAPGDEVFGGAIEDLGLREAGVAKTNEVGLVVEHVAEVNWVRGEAGLADEEALGVGGSHRIRVRLES